MKERDIPMNNNNNKEDWLLWILSDSGLPTGGFIFSSGLESAYQTGHVQSHHDFIHFLKQSCRTFALTSLPYYREAYRLRRSSSIHINSETSIKLLDSFDTSQSKDHLRRSSNSNNLDHHDSDKNNDTTRAQIIAKLLELDAHFDTMNGSNHVVKRASQSQGASLLGLISKGFQEIDCPIIKEFKRKQRKRETFGHQSIAFGLLMSALNISLEKGQQLFLFMHIRSMISAAVRLNLIGPYAGHSLMNHVQVFTDDWIHESNQIESVEDIFLPTPVLDIIQGAHDALYSRMFYS